MTIWLTKSYRGVAESSRGSFWNFKGQDNEDQNIAAMALVSTSIAPTVAFADTVVPPSAAVLNSTTELAMQTQCAALAALRDTGNGDLWTAEVVAGAGSLIAGPTEVEGSRVIDIDSVQGTGTYVPGALEIRGDPFRTGGSVNLFGDQWSTAGYYPDSTYDFTADFASKFSHSFGCNISQEVYHPEVNIPAVPVQGFYTNNGTNPSGSEGSCQGLSPANPHWGEDLGNCTWTETTPAQEATFEAAYHDPAAPIATEAGVAVEQDQTDNLSGFEDHGGILNVTGEYFVGKAVICISPGSKGGSWRVQNGYGGGSLSGPAAGCNTPYFKIAPWGGGSTTSQGTFTSVPQYNLN